MEKNVWAGSDQDEIPPNGALNTTDLIELRYQLADACDMVIPWEEDTLSALLRLAVAELDEVMKRRLN